MTRAIVARRRRHLQSTIPPDKKAELKERIAVLGDKRTADLNVINRARREEQAKLDNKFNGQAENVRREYERNRVAIIEQFEQQFSVDAVQEVLR